MKDIHNNPLFTEITAEEEVSVQGGGIPDLLIWGLKTGAKWALDHLEGVWINTNGRPGAEITGGVYGKDRGNKKPVDANQVWEIQWWGSTYNGYGRSMIGLLTGIKVS